LSNIESLIKCLEPERVKRNEPLAEQTVLGVGGKADLFYTTENSGNLVKAVRLARSFQVPVTVIGEGHGVVISDNGVSGLVIKNTSERIVIKPQKSIFDFFRKREVNKAEVVIDSGVRIKNAIEKMVSMGIVVPEKFELLKGSLGAVVSFDEGKELLKKVSILDEHGGVKSIGADKKVGTNIVIDATYLLNYGDTKLINDKTNKKIERGIKVFEDIGEDEQLALGYSTRDVGHIIGEILNMKGFKIGKMEISDVDFNVIVNKGGGTALDFIKIVEEIKNRARESIGVELTEKVVRLGSW